MVNGLKFRAGKFCLDDLLPALQRLDRLLEQAIAVAQVTYGSAAETDAYRGISIGQDEVEHLFAREIGILTKPRVSTIMCRFRPLTLLPPS
jgi:hypothetical protein